MPRQSRGRAAPARSAPSRPVAAPQRSNATPPGPLARSATTAAHPPAVAGQKAAGVPAQQGGSSPGLFGQMASTAAYIIPPYPLPNISSFPETPPYSTLVFIHRAIAN